MIIPISSSMLLASANGRILWASAQVGVVLVDEDDTDTDIKLETEDPEDDKEKQDINEQRDQ